MVQGLDTSNTTQGVRHGPISESGNEAPKDAVVYYANARRQVLSSHCAMVGLLARKYLEVHYPRWPHWALGALHAGFLHDLGKLDPAFQAQLLMAEPPNTVAGPRIHELSWALTYLAFDPGKVRKLLPSNLPWHVIQYAVFWRQTNTSNPWEQKRFANLEQICTRAGDWIQNSQPSLVVLLADIRTKTNMPVFEVELRGRPVGNVETPIFRQAQKRASDDMLNDPTKKPPQESMDTAIRTGLNFANRMVSAMSALELEEAVQAWCKTKFLPDLVIERERDDYTTVPLDATFTQPLST
jgi:hypothetical protein